MSSVNKVILVGNLGANPELRYSGAGKPICKLSVATHRRWTDNEGQKQEETAWHRVTVFGRQGENCQTYLQRGSQVYIEGRLHRSHYLDKDGAKRYSTEVIANNVVFLGSKSASRGGNGLVEPPVESAAGALDADRLPF